MDTTMNKVVCLCILGLLMGIGGGCRKSISSASRSFSHNFNSTKKGDLATAAKMYDSICRELESRNFKMTENPEMKSSLYKGEYDGFPLTVEIGRLLSMSKEDPEFHYRVSFQKATDVNGVDKASKDLRALMKEWCERSRGVRGVEG